MRDRNNSRSSNILISNFFASRILQTDHLLLECFQDSGTPGEGGVEKNHASERKAGSSCLASLARRNDKYREEIARGQHDIRKVQLRLFLLLRFLQQSLFDRFAGQHLLALGCVVDEAGDDNRSLLQIVGLQAIVDVHV
jgi:hypothetical protein